MNNALIIEKADEKLLDKLASEDEFALAYAVLRQRNALELAQSNKQRLIQVENENMKLKGLVRGLKARIVEMEKKGPAQKEWARNIEQRTKTIEERLKTKEETNAK